MADPDPTQLQGAKSIPARLNVGRNFAGWWNLLQRFLLTTEQSRNLASSGIPGACVGTLAHQITGLSWEIRTSDGQETDETQYYELLLSQARDSTGAVIGFEGLLESLARDVLCANECANYEIFRVPEGPYAGVPVNLIYMDAVDLEPTGNPARPVRQRLPSGLDGPEFAPDEIGRVYWERYNKRGLEFYNRHPILKSYVALAMLSAEDDYTYELLSRVVPVGVLNLGEGFDRAKAVQWKKDWDEAKRGGKTDDIALLYNTSGVDFVPFGTAPSDMPFQHAGYWYLTTVTANFEMSPFDLGFMTQINTKAGSEATVELSRNKGLRYLLTQCKRSFEREVLPEGLELRFPDLDPTDEQAEASIREANTRAIVQATGGKAIMTVEEARAEAVRLKVYEVDPDAPGPEPEQTEEQMEQDNNDVMGEGDEGNEEAAKMVAKASRVIEAGDLRVEVPDTGGDEEDEIILGFSADLAGLVDDALAGRIERDTFVVAVEDLVESYGLSAYMEAGDLRVADLSEDILADVTDYVGWHEGSIEDLADTIYNRDEEYVGGDDDGGIAATLSQRLFLWNTSLLKLMNQARASSAPNQNFVFRLGNTVEHCRDCLRLDGQVHTGREWLQSGLMPQSRNLECEGWQCDCRLYQTNDPVKGAF